jgi:hypothetical protein
LRDHHAKAFGHPNPFFDVSIRHTLMFDFQPATNQFKHGAIVELDWKISFSYEISNMMLMLALEVINWIHQ